MRLIVAILLAACCTGCCLGGDDYLTFIMGGSTPPWGESGSSISPIEVWFPDDKEVAAEPVEVFEAGVRVDVPSSRRLNDNVKDDGCGVSHVITVQLDSLPPGQYTIVHRRSSGTGDPLNCVGECPWTTFEGEEALTFELDTLPRP